MSTPFSEQRDSRWMCSQRVPDEFRREFIRGPLLFWLDKSQNFYYNIPMRIENAGFVHR